VVRHPPKELHASLEIPVGRAIQTLPVSSRAQEFFWGQAQPETKLSKLKTAPRRKKRNPLLLIQASKIGFN